MTRFGHVMLLAAVGALSVGAGALFLAAPPAAPQARSWRQCRPRKASTRRRTTSSCR
jgi:hypothetical protein